MSNFINVLNEILGENDEKKVINENNIKFQKYKQLRAMGLDSLHVFYSIRNSKANAKMKHGPRGKLAFANNPNDDDNYIANIPIDESDNSTFDNIEKLPGYKVKQPKYKLAIDLIAGFNVYAYPELIRFFNSNGEIELFDIIKYKFDEYLNKLGRHPSKDVIRQVANEEFYRRHSNNNNEYNRYY